MISVRSRSAPTSSAVNVRPATTSRWRVWRFVNTQRASFGQSASDYAVACSAEYPLEDVYRPSELGNRQSFDRCVVVSTVTWTVRDHRTAPRREEDVHVARSALFLERRLAARRSDRAGKRASEWSRSRGAHRLFPTLDGDHDARTPVALGEA